jgi:hypothetical protein
MNKELKVEQLAIAYANTQRADEWNAAKVGYTAGMLDALEDDPPINTPQERAEYMCAKITGHTLSDLSMDQAKLFHELSRDPNIFFKK